MLNGALDSSDTSAVRLDLDHDSDTLIIFFSGISREIASPVFEFSGLGSQLSVKKVFIRDIHQAWYQKGLESPSHSANKLVDYLSEIRAKEKPSRFLMVGNSMGGYAALLFGFLLEADYALAFAPQTFIDRMHRLEHLDFRWESEVKEVYKYSHKTPGYFDLKPLLNSHAVKTQFHIFYSHDYRLDRIHATRMSAIPQVTLHQYQTTGEGHKLVKELKRGGALKSIIEQAVAGTL